MQYKAAFVACTLCGTILFGSVVGHHCQQPPHIELGQVEQPLPRMAQASVGSGSGNVTIEVPTGKLQLARFPPIVLVSR